jgi:hypothetical protein
MSLVGGASRPENSVISWQFKPNIAHALLAL